MPIEILMPALSPTMTEGKLAKWLKSVGDSVASGDVIAEIETDKATMEVEAVEEGIMGKILVPEGSEGIKVNSLIALLLEEGEDKSSLDTYQKKGAPQMMAPPVSSEPKSRPEEPPKMTQAQPSAQMQSRIIASPLAKRIAADKKIDLSQIKGSGPRGRIVKADVLNAPANANLVAVPASVSSRSIPAGPGPKSLADALGMPYEEAPNSAVRKIIAQRLTESKQTIPHFYLTVDCELDHLLAMRKEINSHSEAYKISVNDFIIKAVARALKDIPDANASWVDEAILRYKRVDVSVAVATPAGLVTPIIKSADEKSLSQVSAEMKDLATRARDNKLKPQEFQGGGFTISNLGMYGIKEFSAIINPPQSCILAIGAGEERVVVKKGQMVIANMMTCTLSVDHRSVDGAVGAQFLQAFKKYIENPSLALV
ncbi:MAG: pyruvate dehydrogenase complex dihydrolipoamide acetyltransferase [Alphaproteobacteria bacterium]|nr:pyruvate dehydrogenase complex dihydrolipoamide acetyltransferase [Alphaproteobacteria bacterium]MBP9877225.1 pyruvate dehydrogenase complex dihydrolipoamide acetyltransferase [Alphaproteobacteria bacterium]